jgi:hypothetical protein
LYYIDMKCIWIFNRNLYSLPFVYLLGLTTLLQRAWKLPVRTECIQREVQFNELKRGQLVTVSNHWHSSKVTGERRYQSRCLGYRVCFPQGYRCSCVASGYLQWCHDHWSSN